MKSAHKKEKKRILLKITGQILLDERGNLSANNIKNLAQQIQKLKENFTFSIVIGGGNFFHGNEQSKILGIAQNTSHYIGMLATCMNGLILQDIFVQNNIKTTLFSALTCSEISRKISIQNLRQALNNDDCIIFSGGTGNPYFTTDTTAVVRALQINAYELWKGTKVNGIYDKDPFIYKDAQFFQTVSSSYALKNKLDIIDQTAFALARQYMLTIRVFRIFDKNSLVKAATEKNYGSLVIHN
jgi:uridylate kinase